MSAWGDGSCFEFVINLEGNSNSFVLVSSH